MGNCTPRTEHGRLTAWPRTSEGSAAAKFLQRSMLAPSITTTVRNKGTLSTSSWRPDHTLDSFVALPSAKQFPPKN